MRRPAPIRCRQLRQTGRRGGGAHPNGTWLRLIRKLNQGKRLSPGSVNAGEKKDGTSTTMLCSRTLAKLYKAGVSDAWAIPSFRAEGLYQLPIVFRLMHRLPDVTFRGCINTFVASCVSTTNRYSDSSMVS